MWYKNNWLPCFTKLLLYIFPSRLYPTVAGEVLPKTCIKYVTQPHFTLLKSKVKIPCLSIFLVNRAAPTSFSLTFGPHSCASRGNATVGGWPSGSTVCFPPMLFPKVLNVKQEIACTIFQFSGMTQPGIEPQLPHTKHAFYHWATDIVAALMGHFP